MKSLWLFVFAAVSVGATAQQCQTLPLEKTPAGRYGITVKADGHDMRLLVDTGAQYTIIRNKGRVPAKRAASISNIHGSMIAVALGDVEFDFGSITALYPAWGADVRNLAEGMDGILGMDLLGDFDFAISRENKNYSLKICTRN